METDLEINMKIFLFFCAIFIMASFVFVTELSIKTGIIKPFKESSFFENRKAMLAKRYFLIIMSLLCWGLSYLSLRYYYVKALSGYETSQENLNYFLMGSFAFLVYFYVCANHWREEPNQFEKEIEDIGKN